MLCAPPLRANTVLLVIEEESKDISQPPRPHRKPLALRAHEDFLQPQKMPRSCAFSPPQCVVTFPEASTQVLPPHSSELDTLWFRLLLSCTCVGVALLGWEEKGGGDMKSVAGNGYLPGSPSNSPGRKLNHKCL